MDIRLTKETFRDQAKKLHEALKSRGVAAKQSDVLEALAISFGHRNLATMDALLKQDASQYVDATELRKQTENHFIVTMELTDNDGEVMVVFPPGTTVDDVAAYDWKKVEALRERAVALPETMKLESAVALENYSEVPNISKYGLHDGAHESTVTQWILDYFTFKVPKDGVEVRVTDNGADGDTRDHITIWLNDADAQQVRKLFNM